MKRPRVIAATLVEKNGKFLLSKELLEHGKETWVIPGGGVEFGETLEEAAVREIKEETGLDIELTRFLDFKEVVSTEHDYHTVIFFFHGKPNTHEINTNNELIDAKFFGKEELGDLNIVHSAEWLFEKHF